MKNNKIKNYSADKERFAKSKYNNLHQDLIKFLNSFEMEGNWDKDIANVIQHIRHLTIKHNYCSGNNCPWSQAYFEITLGEIKIKKER